MPENNNSPSILAGPIVRYVSSQQITLWLVCDQAVAITALCAQGDTCLAQHKFQPTAECHIQLGERAHVYLLQLQAPSEYPFPEDVWLDYDIGLHHSQGTVWLEDTAPQVLYPQHTRPNLVIKSRVDQLLHGSCRKPHHAEGDGLVVVDEQLQLARLNEDVADQPAFLFLSGDQIYADDVAGPMLNAIHQAIQHLGLYDERLTGARVKDGQGLYRSTESYYQRANLLPDTQANVTLRERFFAGAKKPIFTTANADNHLITLAEVMAMYFLVWSPVLWRDIDLECANLPSQYRDLYAEELGTIEDFVAGLAKVQRALANVPVYMIFDDHDVTDDWNLTRGWEESAYGNPFSRRIIGNALIAYGICQAWGNTPNALPAQFLQYLRELQGVKTDDVHNTLVDELLKFEGWQYTVQTTPKLVVVDTRTRRWRSERDIARPSGLMDWEALSELQQQLMNERAVILVSAAPIFGVKLIEVVQRIFTWFGHALTVDAENWMSHPGAANVILNIFSHKRTPQNFVILSGDVHYSFVYDVRLRHREHSPHIWQISSSGIKNTFPEPLLQVFDRLNRWLFASQSPLNWFTRRRHMWVRQRRPSPHARRYRHQRLVNGCNIGRVRLDNQGAPQTIEVLMSHGEVISFSEGYDSDWVN